MTTDAWTSAREIIGNARVTLGPVASHSWLQQPEHLGFQIARYRAAAALIGNAEDIVEIGAGEGIGAPILARGRKSYYGIDTDTEALQIAHDHHASETIQFREGDATGYVTLTGGAWDAVVSLDTVEHIPPDEEPLYWATVTGLLDEYGIAVIGTPSAHMYQYASPQSKIGHINNFTPERLKETLLHHFYAVQMHYMQDVAIHWGLPAAAHYLIGVGINPRLASGRD